MLVFSPYYCLLESEAESYCVQLPPHRMLYRVNATRPTVPPPDESQFVYFSYFKTFVRVYVLYKKHSLAELRLSHNVIFV